MVLANFLCIYDKLIDSLLINDKVEQAKTYALTFLLLEPGNSFVENQLLPVYLRNKKLNIFEDILDNCIAGEANFYFQKANVLIQLKSSYEEVVKYLEIAKAKYMESSDGTHPAISSIDRYIDSKK